MKKVIDIYTDGACSGNPGPAAIAYVIKVGGKVVKEFSRSIGSATNNIAEYTAVVYALQEALMKRVDGVTVHTDSELLYKQVTGVYKIKDEKIKPLFAQIQHLITGFHRIEFKHIPRAQNNEADGLAKKSIQKEQTKVVAPSP